METPPYIVSSDGSSSTTARMPPFYRFALGQSLPLLLNTSTSSTQQQMLEQLVSQDLWAEFRAECEPLVREISCRDKWNVAISCCLGVVAFVAMMLLVGAPFLDDVVQALKPVLYPILLSYVIFLVYLISMRISYVRFVHLKKIQDLCGKYEPRFTNSCSFECRLERRKDAEAGGYFLYIFPSNNSNNSNSSVPQHDPYLRIEFAPERITACGSKMSRLIRFHTTTTEDVEDGSTIPPGLESLSPNTWNEFWSRVDENSQKYIRCKPFFWLTVSAHLLWLWVSTALGWYEGTMGWVRYSVQFATLLVAVVYWSQMNQLDKSLDFIVRTYAKRFEQQGVCMDYSTVTVFQRYVGGVSRRYLYFFPNKDTATSSTSSSNVV